MTDQTKPNLTFYKIEAASLRHKAYITLQKAIIELDFKPGDLLKKNELCKSLRKFWKLIVLEDLDKVVNNGQGTEDLRDKLKVQELENARELREIKKDISNVEREVLNLTEAHTTCLNELLALRSVKV